MVESNRAESRVWSKSVEYDYGPKRVRGPKKALFRNVVNTFDIQQFLKPQVSVTPTWSESLLPWDKVLSTPSQKKFCQKM